MNVSLLCNRCTHGLESAFWNYRHKPQAKVLASRLWAQVKGESLSCSIFADLWLNVFGCVLFVRAVACAYNTFCKD